jgi:isochorismate synthase
MPAATTPPSARPLSPLGVTSLSPATIDWYRSRGVDWLRSNATVTWERPSQALQVFGLGIATRLAGPRGEGLREARRALEETIARFDVDPAAGRTPLVFAGASFDPEGPNSDATWSAFGGWQVLVPAITLVRRGDEWFGWACAGDFPLDERASGFAPVWEPAGETLGASIAEAVAEIRAGRYQKVVLAGSRAIETGELAPAEVLARLVGAFPTCTIFSFRSGGLSWLGASPEPLAESHGGQVSLISLAGSRRRGRDAAEDASLEHELLTSEKERWEHRLVVDAITAEVQALVEDLDVPATPAVMKLANIQHLCTPIRGRLAPGASLLQLIERLHPTPAVGGWPRAAALDAIRRLERMDRGWYAGPVGWVDVAGDGQFVVGLRTALLGDGIARLYAGAGIVGDSDPTTELDEIETKLDALRGVITR